MNDTVGASTSPSGPVIKLVDELMMRLHAPARGRRARVLRYLVAVGFVAAALALRLAIAPVEAGLPFVTFFPAAALAAIIGGLGPGLLATGLGAVIGGFIFMPSFADHSSILAVMIFVVDEVILCCAMEALHRYFEQIRSRNADLNALAQKLNDANHELERFAFIASHDLQEPLRSVLSFSQILQRSLSSGKTEECSEYLEYIITGATRMNALIQDLLAYSRLSAHGTPFTTVSVAMACQAAIDNLHRAIAESRAEIIVGDLPQVTGDGIQLMQVFQNLIGNALKYRDRERPCRIEVRCERNDGEWVFRVVDNGLGFDVNGRDVFELFARQHRQADYPGSGLGLSVCKRIIRRHGGRIWAESQLGRGSVFSFSLPLA